MKSNLPRTLAAAARARAAALVILLRDTPPAKPDFTIERQARDRRRTVRLGVLLAYDDETRRLSATPLVDGLAVGPPLDAGSRDDDEWWVMHDQAYLALQAAGTAAGLSSAVTLDLMHRHEYDVPLHNLPE